MTWLKPDGQRTKGFNMDGYHKQIIDDVMMGVKRDGDAIILVVGIEGDGKSVFTMGSAYYAYPNLSLDDITFTPDEFTSRVKRASKYQAIVYDEAITGMRARKWASQVNNALIEMIAQIRQKNLIIFIVIPSFFELEKYIALHRSKVLFEVYLNNKGERGYWRAWGRDKKTKLYVKGKKEYNMKVTYPDRRGTFTNFYPVDEAAYRAKKFEALNAPQVPKRDSEQLVKYRSRFFDMLEVYRKQYKAPLTEISKIMEESLTYPIETKRLQEASRMYREGRYSDRGGTPG